MNNELANRIDHAGKDYLQTLSVFSQEQLNSIPFAGSWTAGQVTEHILKSASGVLASVNGETKPTERDPDAHVATLRDAFLNFSIKMQSPDFILPSDGPHDKEELYNAFAKAMAGLAEAARTKDLTVTCLAFEIPGLGQLTRLEFISFIDFHVQRHAYQLKKIYAAISTGAVTGSR